MTHFASRFAGYLAVVCAPAACQAHAVTIPTVPVGNPGNPADTRYNRNGLGSVAYNYRIGATEITNAQYTEFLNAVAASDPRLLYNANMGSQTWGGIVRFGLAGTYTYAVKTPALGGTYIYNHKPVVYVSWFDALRFANWLHNGQPTGAQDPTTTEDGAYTFGGISTVGTRHAGARWWLPSEDEWYKAAYHQNVGVTGNYWDYPTGADSVPNNNLPSNDTGNSANFDDSGAGDEYTTGDFSFPMTDAGAYTQSYSPYGTFDQGGNVWEWNERHFMVGFGFHSGLRGGSWDNESDDLHAKVRSSAHPMIGVNNHVGFRVASILEPDGMPGDFNHDGTVDAADYVVWRKNDGTQSGYGTWRSHFGQSTAGSSVINNAVPEPGMVAMLFVGMLSMLTCPRRELRLLQPRFSPTGAHISTTARATVR